MQAEPENTSRRQAKAVRTISRAFLTVSGLCVVLAIASMDRSQPRHAAFHVNCPPGSHTSPAWAGFGRKLAHARERANERKQSQARAITAGHPQLPAGGQP